MAKRVISTSIQLDGEAEFKRQMSAVNSELKTLKTEMAYNEAAFKGQANSVEALTAKDKLLRQEIEQQQEKVRALEKAVEETNDAYEAGDKRADAWRQSLNRAKTDLLKMNRELQDTDRYLDEARRSANKTADSIDEMGREAKEAGESFQGMDGLADDLAKIKNLAVGGAVGGALIGGLVSIKDAIVNVVDATAEYRKIMGTLDVSSQKAGYTAEQTAESYGLLYSVLGDNQTAATATANLQALQVEQSKLEAITMGAIGAWATYGDSIPIDSLAEAINETARAGTVTGTFADVLNWGAAEGETYGVKLREANEANKEWNEAVNDAKTAEDYFNLALSDCETQSERVDLILQAMAKQGLTDQAEAWLQVNESTVKANEAQAKYEESLATLGEKLVPVKTALVEFATDAVDYFSERVDAAKKAWQDFLGWLDDLKTRKLGDHDAMMEAQGLEKYYDENGQERWRAVDGSHAGGLNYVPFDGYRAELHRGEAVLTAQENRIWQQFREAGRQSPPGVTAAELQTMLVGTVNALGSQQSGGVPREITLRLKTDDGQVMGRWLVPFVRSEDRSNPEVVSDT